MTAAALSLAYTCLEVVTEVVEEVEAVDTQYRTSYNCYSSKTKYTTEYSSLCTKVDTWYQDVL